MSTTIDTEPDPCNDTLETTHDPRVLGPHQSADTSPERAKGNDPLWEIDDRLSSVEMDFSSGDPTAPENEGIPLNEHEQRIQP